MKIILIFNYVMLTCSQVIPNLTIPNTTTPEVDYDVQDSSESDYVIDDETLLAQIYQKCSKSTLRATHNAQILSSYDVTENVTMGGYTYSKTWNIASTTPGAKVTVTIREISENYLFSTSCYDVMWSSAAWNHSANMRSWCQHDSLLSCGESDKMYFYFGMNTLQAPPYRALQITQNIVYDPYGYFKLYYYECGGRVGSGYITSPSFPPNDEIGEVRCTWHLHIPGETDYGILKMNRFNLPSCSVHKIMLMEDTLIPEEDITDEILNKLKQKTLRTRREANDSNYYDEASSEYDYYYPGEVTPDPSDIASMNSTDYSAQGGAVESFSFQPILEFYREDPLDNSSRSGIHAVLITTYCGSNKPNKTFYWRKGSKNVSISYVSTQLKKGNEHFRLSFTVFSWRTHLEGHPNHNLKRKLLLKKKKSILEDWPNYIGVMLFLPLGFIIGLTIIIVHVVRSGPSLRDFYKKERKESIRRQRAQSVPDINIRDVPQESPYFPNKIRRYSARRFESFRSSFRRYKQGEAVNSSSIIIPLDATINEGVNKVNHASTHIIVTPACCDNNGNIV